MSNLHECIPDRVLIVKPSALGDVVQSLPVLTALKERWRQARFTWVVNRSLAGLLSGHPDLDQVVPFDRAAPGIDRLRSTRSLARRLRQGRFDVALDLQGLFRSAVMTRLSGAPIRVGYANAREGAPWFYTHLLQIPESVQAAHARYWMAAKAFGCLGEPPPARFGFTDDDDRWAQQQLADVAHPILAIHPGAQWVTKRWPTAHFGWIARQAQVEFGAGIVLLGGPGEEDLCRAVAEGVDQAMNLAGRTSLLRLATVLRRVDLVLSGDTGPMHLAAAVGTRVAAVFTCTSPARAGPIGAGHRILSAPVPCAASYLKRCSSLVCMRELTPERVWPEVRSALAQSAPSRAKLAVRAPMSQVE
jgi:lipopolysaccharide heptosyltransferase I